MNRKAELVRVISRFKDGKMSFRDVHYSAEYNEAQRSWEMECMNSQAKGDRAVDCLAGSYIDKISKIVGPKESNYELMAGGEITCQCWTRIETVDHIKAKIVTMMQDEINARIKGFDEMSQSLLAEKKNALPSKDLQESPTP